MKNPIGRKGKYNANGRRVNELWFASDSEATRYEQLIVLQNDGLIDRLETQPQLSISIKNKHICNYRADFKYLIVDDRGYTTKMVYEDVKGMITDVYKLKKKMVEAFYDMKIVEIPAKDIKKWEGKLP